MPTSGSGPAYTFAPRPAASSWTPRHAPKYGIPARTASPISCFSSASQGSDSSSLTLIGPPIATIASNPSISGAWPISSISHVAAIQPRSRITSANAPGGSHAMC